MLSFFGGAHSCIGFRFSVVEYVYFPSSGRPKSYLCRLKAILYTLIRAFDFELAVDADEIVRSRALPMSPRLAERPYLRSDPKRRAQMPLYITSVRRNE